MRREMFRYRLVVGAPCGNDYPGARRRRDVLRRRGEGS